MGDTRELSKIFFENVTVIPIDDLQNNLFSNLVDSLVNLKMKGENYIAVEDEIEKNLAEIYLFSDQEKNLINSGM